MEDPAQYSALLRRLHDKWWHCIVNKDFKQAAYVANDLESTARHLCSSTHALFEATDAAAKAPLAGHPSSTPPPADGGSGQ